MLASVLSEVSFHFSVVPLTGVESVLWRSDPGIGHLLTEKLRGSNGPSLAANAIKKI